MSHHSKHKKDTKQVMVRIISLSLAVIMVLSVVFAAVWQW